MKKRLIQSALFFTLMLFAVSIRAADIVWTNAASGNWTTAANWNPNQVPAAADIAVITNAGSYVVTLSIGTTISGLTLGLAGDSGVRTLQITAGTLVVTNTFSESNGIINLNGGTMTSAGPFNSAGAVNENSASSSWRLLTTNAFVNYFNQTNGELRGGTLTITNCTWIAGNWYADAPGDKTIIATNGVFNFPGTATRVLSYYAGGFGRYIDNYGTWNWSTNSSLVAYPCTVNNYGTVNISGTGAPGTFSQFVYQTATRPVWNNYGTVTKSPGTNLFYFACDLNNYGTLNFQSGTVSFYASKYTNAPAGSILIGTGAQLLLELGSSITFSPGSAMTGVSSNALRLDSATAYMFSTNFSIPSLLLNHASAVLVQNTNNVIPTINQNLGTWQLTVPTTVGTYNLNAGELRGGTLIVTNLNWSGGNMNADLNGDKTIIPSGGVLNFNTTASRFLSYNGAATAGRGLDNHGTWNWNGDSILYALQTGCVVNNYGSVIVTNTGIAYFTYYPGYSAPIFNNYGTFTKSGADIFYFQACFLNNYNLMNFQSGFLIPYASTFTNFGTLNLSASASFYNQRGASIDSFTYFASNSVVTSPGVDRIQVQSGNMYVQTTNISSPTLLISGGSLFQQAASAVPTVNLNGGTLFQQSPVAAPTVNQTSGTWWSSVATSIGTYNMTNGELRGANITITNFNWLGGALNSENAASNTVTIPPTGTLTISGATAKGLSDYSGGNGRRLINQGTGSWSGAGITGSHGPYFINQGSLNLIGDFSLVNGGGTGIPTLINSGTLTKTSGGGSFTLSTAILNNSSTVSINSGSINITGQLLNSGSIVVSNGTLALATTQSISTNSGSVTLGANSFADFNSGTISLGGSIVSPTVDHIRFLGATVNLVTTNLTTPTLLLSAGTLNQSTNFTVNTLNQVNGAFYGTIPVAIDTYNMTNGELRGANVTITNFNWRGGALNSENAASNTVTIPNGGTLIISTATAKGLSDYSGGNGRRLINRGVGFWSGAGITGSHGPHFVNQGTLDLTGDFSLVNGGGTGIPLFNNSGTVNLTAGSDFTLSAAILNNSSNINIAAGSITIGTSSIATNTGTLNLDAGSIFQFSGATLNLGGTVNAPGNNSLRFAGTSAFINTPNISSPSLWLQAGTIYQATNITVNALNQAAGVFYATTPLTIHGYNMTNGELRGANVTINNFNWLGGALNSDNAASNTVTVSGTLNISGATAKNLSDYSGGNGRRLINQGTGTWSGAGIVNSHGALLINQGSLTLSNDVGLVTGGGTGTPALVNLGGTFTKTGSPGVAAFTGVAVTNSGSINIANGGFTVGGVFVQTAGAANLGTNFTLSSTARIDAGTFTGRGSIAGVTYNNGVLNPGASPGLITGTSFTNSAAGTINIELGGINSPGTNYDQIRLTGAATLNGTMNVSLWNNFAPSLSNSFTVMTFASRTGTFPAILSPPGITLEAIYSTTNLVLTVTALTNVPLQITQYPANQSVYQSDPATFFVAVSGTTPINYQWQFNSTNILGATNSDYSIISTALTNAGNYTVLITDGIGATTNASASLTVIPYDGTINWTNTAGGNWNVAANWVPNRVPGNTNHAVISVPGTYTVTVNNPTVVGRVTVGDSSANGQPRLNIYHDFTLEVAGNVGTNGIIDFNYNLLGAGSFTNNGLFYWGGGTMAGTGAFVNGTNGNLQTYANGYKYLNRVFNNYGKFDFTVSDGYGVQIGNGGLFTNAAVGNITLSAGQNGFSAQGGTTNGALYNFGTLTANGSPSIIYAPFFNEPGGTLLVNNSCYVASGTNRGTINIPHPLASVSFVSPSFAFNSGTVLQGYGAIGVGFSGVLNINAPIVCSNAFGISAGQLYNPALNLNANLTTYGTFTVGTGDLNISPAATLDAQTLTLSWFYQTYTHAYITSAGNIIANNLNLSYGTFFNSGTINVRNNLNFTGVTLANSGNGRLITQTNSSTSIGQASVSVFPYLGGGVWDNHGTVGWTFGGVLNIYNGAGIINHSNATMNLNGNGIFVNTDATNWLVNYGLIQRGGFASTPSFDLITTNYNTVLLNNTAMWVGRYVQWAGLTDIGGATINGPKFDIRGGEFSGAGTIQNGGTLVNSATLRPGSTIGILSIGDGFTNAPGGVHHMEIGGNLSGQYDRINVSAPVQLAGTLNVIFTNGFYPTIGNTFTSLTYTARSGVFDSIQTPNYQFEVLYTPTALLLRASNALPIITFNITGGNTQLVCNPFNLISTSSDLDGVVTNMEIFANGSLIASKAGSSIKTTFESDFPQSISFVTRGQDDRGGYGYKTQQVELVTFSVTNELFLGGMRSNGVFKICMIGETGSNYTLFATTNLQTPFINWTNLGFMENINGIRRYLDTDATNYTYRFYRARQE